MSSSEKTPERILMDQAEAGERSVADVPGLSDTDRVKLGLLATRLFKSSQKTVKIARKLLPPTP